MWISFLLLMVLYSVRDSIENRRYGRPGNMCYSIDSLVDGDVIEFHHPVGKPSRLQLSRTGGEIHLLSLLFLVLVWLFSFVQKRKECWMPANLTHTHCTEYNQFIMEKRFFIESSFFSVSTPSVYFLLLSTVSKKYFVAAIFTPFKLFQDLPICRRTLYRWLNDSRNNPITSFTSLFFYQFFCFCSRFYY